MHRIQLSMKTFVELGNQKPQDIAGQLQGLVRLFLFRSGYNVLLILS